MNYGAMVNFNEPLNPILDRVLHSLDFSDPFVLLDFLVASAIVLVFMMYLRRFPSFRVIIGTLILFVTSLFFMFAGFVYTSLIFGVASVWVLLSLPLIFSPEIRHYLGRLGRLQFLNFIHLTDHEKDREFVRSLVDTIFELADKKTGATIVIARQTALIQTIDTGVLIDAQFSSKLIQAIFYPKNPLHDGAVIMKGTRIAAAACLLPISGDVRLESPFGTRHKSGVAVTRDTDAISLIVSEERGQVSFAENGKLSKNLDRIELHEKLGKVFQLKTVV